LHVSVEEVNRSFAFVDFLQPLLDCHVLSVQLLVVVAQETSHVHSGHVLELAGQTVRSVRPVPHELLRESLRVSQLLLSFFLQRYERGLVLNQSLQLKDNNISLFN